MKANYDNVSMDTLFSLLNFMEAVLSAYNKIQDQIKYYVNTGKLTDSEVAPLVHRITEAYVEIDKNTIEIEKALDKKVRNLTGIRHLSQSAVRFEKQFQDLLKDRKENNGKVKDLKIDYGVPDKDRSKDESN